MLVAVAVVATASPRWTHKTSSTLTQLTRHPGPQAVYRAALKQELTYIGQLVGALRDAFGSKFGEAAKNKPFQPFDFADEFAQIRRATENQARKDLLAPKTKTMRSFEETSKFKKTLQHNEELQSGKLAERKKQQQVDAAANAATPDSGGEREETEAERKERRRLEFIESQKTGKRRVPGKMKKEVKGKQVKEAGNGKAVLDYSNPNDVANDDDGFGSGGAAAFNGQEIGEMDAEEVVIPETTAPSSGLFSFFNKLGGASTITKENLAPVLLQMRDHLITKNVGADIAEKICDGVGESLVGKSKGTFSKIASVVKESMDATLTKCASRPLLGLAFCAVSYVLISRVGCSILMPKRVVNILRDVAAKRRQKQPYVICFCGVNGTSSPLCLCVLVLGNLRKTLADLTCTDFMSSRWGI